MSGPSIIIVSYNWPPRNAIGTHRPYAWARYWSEAGARVTVLTARKQPFDAPLDLTLPPLSGVDVIEVPYGGAGRLAGRLLKSEKLTRWAKQGKRLLMRRALLVDPRAGWRNAAQTEGRRLAKEADIVVSTFGPPSAHLIANDMKRANPALRWVADYRDLWSQRHTADIPDRARAAMRAMECDTVGQRADLMTAVSDDMVRQLHALTDKPVIQVPNGFDLDEQAVKQRLETPLVPLGDRLHIVYTGTLYEGHQDPTPLLDALVTLCRSGGMPSKEITVDFYGARVDVAKKLAEIPKYRPFIRIMGHVSRQEALAAQRAADLLLLLESPAPEAKGVLTGKLFEYIAAGRPILCVGSRPEYEIGKVLSTTRTGVAFGPDEYGNLELFLKDTFHGDGLFARYEPNIEEVMRYSRKRLAEDMLSVILKV